MLSYRPQLVIWQTGSSQVLGGGDVDAYARTVREGIGRLKAARIDIVLMDPQFAPRVPEAWLVIYNTERPHDSLPGPAPGVSAEARPGLKVYL